MSAISRLRAARRRQTGRHLRVDPVACDGVGQCAMAASRLIELDRWGYPVMPSDELVAHEVGAAERAVRSCPHQALWIEERD